MRNKNNYDVVVKYSALKGIDLSEATNDFHEAFEGVPEDFGGESFDGKNEVIVATGVDLDEAERIRKKVEDIGLLAHARHRDGYDAITKPFLGAIPLEEYAFNKVFSESALIEAIKGGLFQGVCIKGRWFIEKDKFKYPSRSTQSSASRTYNSPARRNSHTAITTNGSDFPFGIVAIICSFGSLLPFFGYFFLPVSAILGVIAIKKGQTTSGVIALAIAIILFIAVTIGAVIFTKDIIELDRELRNNIEESWRR